MKNTSFIGVFLLALSLAGCDSKGEMDQIGQELKRAADSIAQHKRSEEIEKMRAERRKTLEAGDIFIPEIANSVHESKIKEGRVFLLSNDGETIPLKYEENKIIAVTLPDGKLYNVEKEEDKTLLTVQGKGKIERREVNGKIYLVDDDGQMYAVKVVNQKLIAMLDDGTEVNLAKK